MAITIPGAYPAITPDAYHADPCAAPSLSSTLARLIIDRSPAHAWTASPRLNPDFEPVEKTHFDIGSAAHRMLVGKGARVVPIDAENWTTKAAKADRDAVREAGHIPVLAAQFESTENMVAEVRRKLARMGLDHVFADPARAEVVYAAEIGGVWCRCMVDWMDADRWVYDFKTTTDAAPDAVSKAVANYGYDVQQAHYMDTITAATGSRPRGWRLVFAEKEAPHAVQVVELADDMAAGDDWMGPARDRAKWARRLWRDCLAANDWPAYPDAVLTIGAPIWRAANWEDRKAALANAPKPKPSPAAREAAAAMMAFNAHAGE